MLAAGVGTFRNSLGTNQIRTISRATSPAGDRPDLFTHTSLSEPKPAAPGVKGSGGSESSCNLSTWPKLPG